MKNLHIALRKSTDMELRRLIIAYNEMDDEDYKRVLVRTAESLSARIKMDKQSKEAEASLRPKFASV